MREYVARDRPLVFAHRGYSGRATENTRSAITRALSSGAHGIEVDLRKTADGELVLFHDENARRLTGEDLKIEEVPWERLMSLPLPGGEGIIRLGDVLDIVAGRVLLNLEIKTRGIGREVLAAVGETGYGGPLIFSSFHGEDLEDIRRERSDIPVALIARRAGDEELNLAKSLGCVSVHVKRTGVTEELVGEVHRLGMCLFAYTVNAEAEFFRLARVGVDGFFTNYPGEMLRWREKVVP